MSVLASCIHVLAILCTYTLDCNSCYLEDVLLCHHVSGHDSQCICDICSKPQRNFGSPIIFILTTSMNIHSSNGLYIICYILYAFIHVTVTMNSYYNSYCTEKMTNFERGQLEIELEFMR